MNRRSLLATIAALFVSPLAALAAKKDQAAIPVNDSYTLIEKPGNVMMEYHGYRFEVPPGHRVIISRWEIRKDLCGDRHRVDFHINIESIPAV